MRRNPWLRLFLSYLSVFLFLSASLSVIFLAVIGRNAGREAQNANQVYARNVIKTFDSWLAGIEQTVIRETLTNVQLQQFFGGDHTDETYSSYLLYSRLRELLSTVNSIDSFYLYRTSDLRILSDSHMMSLNEFPDSAFINSYMTDNPGQVSWFAPRNYKAGSSSAAQTVVSLVMGIPFNTAAQGLIVLNIPLYSIQDMLQSIAQSDIHYAYLASSGGLPFDKTEKDSRRDAAVLVSEKTGWALHSGVKDAKVGSLLSLFSNSWLLAVGGTVLAALILLFLVFWRNYKPIDAISNRIAHFIRKDQFAMDGDQFAFIEAAVERLIHDSQLHEEQAARDSGLKKRYLFRDLVTGTQYISQNDWQEELKKLGLPQNCHSYLVILVEMDEYAAFEAAYSEHDRLLLKFALRSVVQEMADSYRFSVWIDWLSGDRIGSLVFLDEANYDALPDTLRMCEELRAWVEQYLKFTVTIGFGDGVQNLASIPQSYEAAAQMLEVKASAGSNQVITHETLAAKPAFALMEQLPAIHSMAHLFRTGNKEWEAVFRGIFATVRTGLPPRKTITDLADYLLLHCHGEIGELSEEAVAAWTPLYAELKEWTVRYSNVNELEEKLFAGLSRMFGELARQREKNPQYTNLDLFKAYIDAGLGDPNLSLNQISEHFHLTPQHFSAVFKELQGEKFVDYLIRIRMEKAKLLLETTSLSVQDVALAVGYVHSFSFIRVFKRVIGSTPGEFRRQAGGD